MTASLTKKSIVGVGWTALGNIIRQALQVVTMVVMARLLSPEDFGLFAIVMVFAGFMHILGSMGTAQVVIHLDRPSQGMLSSILYFNIAIGSLLCIILFFLAAPLAYFFDDARLQPLLQLISFVFVIASFSFVQKALLEKGIQFRKVIMLETLAMAAGSVLGIVAAMQGFGVVSLVLVSMTNAFIFSLGLWVSSDWKPGFRFARNDIFAIWDYTVNLTGFNIINYFARNTDTFLIGKFIGPAGLGLYSLCYRIMLYPLDNISRVVVRVLFPAFSAIKSDNVRFRRGYLKAITTIAFFTFPIMLGLFASVEAFVMVVFGEKWRSMSSILMVLAPVGMIQSIVTTVGCIYTAKGTTRLMLKIGALNSAVIVLSFVVGLPFGVLGVAISYSVANLIMLYPNLMISWRQIDLSVKQGIQTLLPILYSSLLMAALVWLLGNMLSDYGYLTILFSQVVLGCIIYPAFVYTFSKKHFIDVCDQIKALKK